MGERLDERITATRAGELPDLGARMVRLGEEGQRLVATADRYEAQYGRIFQHFNSTPEQLVSAQKAADEGGMLHRNVVIQDVSSKPYDWTRAPGMMLYVSRFVSPAAAEAWFASNPARTERWSYFVAWEPVDQELTIGDEAVAFETAVDHGSGPMPGHVVFVRNGNDVVEVRTHALEGVSLETAVALAKIQIGCLRESGCPDRVPVPADMRVG